MFLRSMKLQLVCNGIADDSARGRFIPRSRADENGADGNKAQRDAVSMAQPRTIHALDASRSTSHPSQEISMSKYYARHAFTLATFVAAGMGAPLTPALAASATTPNMMDNAVAGRGGAPTTGVYDGYDTYRDAKGFPLPGWDILLFPPS
jgi:hypothetical protein